jgi:hypothetical protein
MRNKIQEIKEKINNNLFLNNLEGKLDIKLIKEEMNKLIDFVGPWLWKRANITGKKKR